MSELTFRAMQKEDVPRIAELERICFRSPWSENSLRGELKNRLAHYRLAVLDGQTIGYAGMWVLFEEAHVTNVAIAPEQRGNGFGRAIMLELMAVACAHRATRMTLEVRASNVVAQALYYSMDFKQAGLRKGYYADTGEDGLILWNDDIRATIDTQSAK